MEELNRRLRCNKTAEKCIRKMKYIISRYKELQEWNRKQSGGRQKFNSSDVTACHSIQENSADAPGQISFV